MLLNLRKWIYMQQNDCAESRGPPPWWSHLRVEEREEALVSHWEPECAQGDPSPPRHPREEKKEGRKERQRKERADGEGVLGVGDVLGQRAHLTAMRKGWEARTQRRSLVRLDLDIEVIPFSRMRRTRGKWPGGLRPLKPLTTQDFACPSDQHPRPQYSVLWERPPGQWGPNVLGVQCVSTDVIWLLQRAAQCLPHGGFCEPLQGPLWCRREHQLRNKHHTDVIAHP